MRKIRGRKNEAENLLACKLQVPQCAEITENFQCAPPVKVNMYFFTNGFFSEVKSLQ
jgi:hypothetical protein